MKKMEMLERRAAEIRDRQVGITARRNQITKEIDSAAFWLGATGVDQDVLDYLSLKLRYLQREREMLTAESEMLAKEMGLLRCSAAEEEAR